MLGIDSKLFICAGAHKLLLILIFCLLTAIKQFSQRTRQWRALLTLSWTPLTAVDYRQAKVANDTDTSNQRLKIRIKVKK